MTPTFKFISKASSAVKCSSSLVFKWHQRFSAGDDRVEDQIRSGRKKKIADAAEISRVGDVINEDRRRAVREIGAKLTLGKSTAHRVLRADLGMIKVSARWVPSMLKDEEKQKRVLCSTEFLRRYDREGERFLRRIKTRDETWMFLYEPKSKREAMVWTRSTSPPPKKARTSKSAKKYMFIFFMDMDGMLLQHVVPSNRTVNAAYYQKVSLLSICVLFKNIWIII